MAGGRPPIFNTPEELQTKVDEYFKTVSKEEPATITGLALYLGFESRQSFYDYETKEGFSYSIKRARLRIENRYEQKLHENSNTGAIFALKNLGWKDKTETEIPGYLSLRFNCQKQPILVLPPPAAPP